MGARVVVNPSNPPQPDEPRRPPQPDGPHPQKPVLPSERRIRRNLRVESTPQLGSVDAETALGTETLDMSRPIGSLPRKQLLLNPKWVRGIFSSRLSVTTDSRELDVAACMRHEMQDLPYRHVPWLPIQTMSTGVRCYVDAGTPFDILSEDRHQVILGLRSLAGFERVSVKSFETVPDARTPSAAAELVPPEAPLLLVTDFGHYALPGRRWASPAEWLAYIERERASGTTRIVALTPLDPADWPSPLRFRIEIVRWDWQTAVRTARAT
jgi:hypothetical protein